MEVEMGKHVQAGKVCTCMTYLPCKSSSQLRVSSETEDHGSLNTGRPVHAVSCNSHALSAGDKGAARDRR